MGAIKTMKEVESALPQKKEINYVRALVGYMNIKRKKGETLSIKLTVNGHVYSFNWNVSTRK